MRGTTTLRRLLETAAALILSAIAVEGTCQVYALHLRLANRALRQDPLYYYAPSPDPILVYELAKNRTVLYEDRRLHLNRCGIRDDEDSLPPERARIGLVGDSVVFGIKHTQELTLSVMLEARLRKRAGAAAPKVLNLGVPGYALREVAERMKQMDAVYRPDAMIYLMNPNDFALRDTQYAGADDGLYLMYRMPWWKTPLFFDKVVYRFHKGAEMVSEAWYRWLYEGTKSTNLRYFDAMAEYARASSLPFHVVLLPAGCAYTLHTSRLAGMYEEISRYLDERKIPHLDATAALSTIPWVIFDNIDHLTTYGAELVADVFDEYLAKQPPLRAREHRIVACNQ